MPDRTAALWLQAAREGLRPPERLPLSQWLERNLRLPQGLAAEPGPIRLWPYQKSIADALNDPEIERVTLVKRARTGFRRTRASRKAPSQIGPHTSSATA